MNIKTLTTTVLFSLAALTGAHAQQGAFMEIPPGFFSALRGGTSPGSFLGVYLSEVGPETVRQLGLEEEVGAHINEVIDDSPAAEAGLQADDVIVGWNENRVESSQALKRMVSETPPGRSVRLDVVRDSETQVIDVEIGQQGAMRAPRGMPMPQAPWQHPSVDDWTPPAPPQWRADDHKAKLGVLLQNLTGQLGAYFGLADRSGALIVEVLDDSIAQAAGLKAGDVITEIDGVEIETSRDVQRAVSELSGNVDISVMRDREDMTVGATFPEQEEEIREHVIPADDEEDDAGTDTKYPGSAM